MGSRFRHFCALMKKNWIVWKRTLASSLCELFCPVCLMAILAIARALISISDVDAKSNIPTSAFFAPVDYLASNNLNASLMDARQKYQSYLNFSGLTIEEQNAVLNFLPSKCRGQDQQDRERPIVAYSGKSSLTDPIVQSLIRVQSAQAEYIQSNLGNPNPNIQRSIQKVQQALIQFQYKEFDSYDAIRDYLSSKQYQQNDDHPGVCFGFSIDEIAGNQYEVRLFFNDRADQDKAQMIPSQLLDAYSIFQRDQDTDSFKLYTKQGYSFLQNWIANAILQQKTNNTKASIAMTFVPVKTDKYISDDYGLILKGMLPFFMLLMYILPVYRLISNMVSEKESKARESMKMMGLSDSSYWLSWFTYYFIVVTIISILCLIILAQTVFKNSQKGYIFAYFWVYGMSLFGLCMLIQAFFSRARVAAITGTLIYFGTSFIDVAVSNANVSRSSKTLASLLSTIAVSRGANNLALFETNGMGVTDDTASEIYQNYRFIDCLILMTISFFICVWLGIYLDNVLPSAYGLRKPWYFCLTSRYWLGSKTRNRIHQRLPSGQDIENLEDMTVFEAQDMKKENFEPPSRDLKQQELENKILKIQGLRKVFDNGFQAVKGLNIKMYNGQIFALLGHNGAGKTTTISMLTGLINASQGDVEVLGYDLFNDMSTVRNFLGVCPQHDILFDLLTPEEHLDIFCDFKGVDRKTKKEEIRKMLIDVDVIGNKDTEARNLSGGSRRKLSVAIALIGGSKLVLLDEPTSGMDLSARRKLWNMLKNYKTNRIIILTTHYMDEADILGDRIGIMTGGQLICLGSSLFLKNRFGVGYNLTMVKKNKEPNFKIGKYLQEMIGDVKKLSEVSSEITYQIPTALSYKFKDFFTYFDQELDKLDIRSYGISVTTLEEVFLRVGHGDEDESEKLRMKEELLKSKGESQMLLDVNDDYSIAEDHETGFWNVFGIHLNAQFRKRLALYRRNYLGLVVEVFIPVLLVLIGFAFSTVSFFFSSSDRVLRPYQFPLEQRLTVNQNSIIKSGIDYLPSELIGSLPDYSDSFEVTYKDYSGMSLNNYTSGNYSGILDQFDDDFFQSRLVRPYKPFRYGTYFIYEANKKNNQFKISTFMNLTSQDSAALYPQFMYESILKQATGDPNFQFKVITSAYPISEQLRQRQKTGNGIFIVFVVSIGFALIPAAVISFIVNEREKNLKHMQLISGMNLSAYWISNLCFDVLKGIIPSAIVIGLMYAFKLEYDYVWILFLLFSIGVIPFTYVTSFLFTKENVAQTVTIFLHFVIAGIGAIVAGILRLISSTYVYGDALVWVFKIIPSYCLTDSILYQSIKSRLFLLRPDIKHDDLHIMALGGDILVMCLHFIFWCIILIMIEGGVFKKIGRLFSCCCSQKRIPPKHDLVLDDDVEEEENRLTQPDENMKVRVHKFRKVYTQPFKPPFLAVERTSFGLDYGECFALLGVNGAGKSTTFKSLTGEIEPTAGEITINGMSVSQDFAKVRKLIGYCPQYDAIFDLMTVEEHLDYYARIKGIRKEIRTSLIEKQIKEMNLTEHRKKPAGTLSGGNKRKLSVAMCVIGNPPIILLDEPSAGMDPEARRFMWSVVARISQQRKKSAVIITTHSMEEAEALSTKMGIMVKGGVFRCFGSSQHIKSKFATGYEIEVKVRKLENSSLEQMIGQFGLGNRETISINEIQEFLRQRNIDPILYNEIKLGGLGNDIVSEANEHNGEVSVKNFVLWLYVEQCGLKIINGLCEDFNQVEILEHFNDYYKFRVPKGSKSIGFVFSLIENKKAQYSISEYSASQTTLEQIFQSFANLKIDQDESLKFRSRTGVLEKLQNGQRLPTDSNPQAIEYDASLIKQKSKGPTTKQGY